MNILQILPELNVGGVETGTIDLSKYLVRSGHKSVVVSAGGELVNDLEINGGVHYQLPVQKKSLFTIFKTIPLLADIIRKEKIDIVHARSRVPAWIAYFACRMTNTVLITTCHGYYKKHYFSYVMGWAKRVIAISNVIARHMIDDFDVPHDRIRLIARSVDLEKFKYLNPGQKRTEDFNVGIIGRITPLKGHLYFIKAMAKACRRIPRLKIWIIGDAPNSREAYKEELQVLVKRLGLWHCTQFLGTQRNIPDILSHLDTVVLATTTHEAFGRVIVEAQAAGVPVVATEVGGVVDIIENEKTGLLVAPADPTAMADAVVRIFKDHQLASDLARNAYQRVKERYNLELMVKKTIDVYQEALNNSRILIIKFSSLGDLILSTAAIKAIRNKFSSNYKISFLVSEEFKEVLLECPYIDELIVADFKNKDSSLPALFKLGAALRKRNFDIVIDLQNNRKSHILSFLTLALKRYGYDNKKLGFLLNFRIKDDKAAIDPVTHQFRILKMLGIDSQRTPLELWLSKQDTQYIDDLLSSQWLSVNQKIVGINISASQRWASKALPLSHIVKVCQGLGRQDIRVIVTGTESDSGAAGTLMNMAKETKIINACGRTTINQLACLIRKCAVYVSGDSSPLHIAAAVGTPFIALFGPTDPRRHLVPVESYALIHKHLSCSPCYKPKCKSKKCMELIRPEEVLGAVDKLLNKN